MIGPGVGSSFYSGVPLPFPGAQFGADFTSGKYQLNGAVYSDPTSLPGWTFTRASTGTALNTAGNLSVFASGVPRITDKGLLVEEARTQYVRNANGIGGSASVMPTNWSLSAAGLSSLTIVGYGTDDNGHSYVDIRAQGTPAASAAGATIAFDTTTGVPAAEAEVWTASADISLIAGSTSGITSVSLYGIQRTAAAALIGGLSGSDIKASLTSTPQRFTATFSALVATTAYFQPFIRIVPVSGATIDMTLRIKYPQWEKGTFATSYIPTTTASATRAADVAALTGLSIATNATLYVQGLSPVGVSTDGRFTLSDGSTDNRLWLQHNGTNLLLNVMVGTVSLGGGKTTATALNAAFKAAISVSASRIDNAQDGTAGAGGVGTTLPAMTRIDIGQNAGASGRYWNNYISRAVVYPYSQTAAQLAALTT